MVLRLIHTEKLKLQTFKPTPSNPAPSYAILSHRWGDEKDEVNFQQFTDSKYHDRPGYSKIKDFCAKAAKHGYRWAWVDTCCIDKSGQDASELSEAINSMFVWYQEADCCYVYLNDVTFNTRHGEMYDLLKKSAWFKRGWTLQELIAPKVVCFYDSEWDLIGKTGKKSDVANAVSKITRIDRNLLYGRQHFKEYSIAQRMSWAACRQTTKVEDRAYSLLGVFDIRMTLNYGEGHIAFKRLQEKLLKVTPVDWTLLVWEPFPSNSAKELERTSILAPSPDCFHSCTNIVRYTDLDWQHFWNEFNLSFCYGQGCASQILPKGGQILRISGTIELQVLCQRIIKVRRENSDVYVIGEVALPCYERSEGFQRPCTIILAVSSKDQYTYRAIPYYAQAVTMMPHMTGYYHWKPEKFIFNTSGMWEGEVSENAAQENLADNIMARRKDASWLVASYRQQEHNRRRDLILLNNARREMEMQEQWKQNEYAAQQQAAQAMMARNSSLMQMQLMGPGNVYNSVPLAQPMAHGNTYSNVPIAGPVRF
jgi:hypothetical protein